MAHSYTSNIVHCVFSTKDRTPSIQPAIRERLWAYMLGIAKNLHIPILAIGGVDNHVHILFILPSTQRLSETIQRLKANSARWMNENGCSFAWQEGYGAFSVSPSRIDAVQRYVRHQAEHHEKRNFEEEFIALLKQSGIPYDPRFVFG